jgi:hypothetical protein
MLLLLLTSAAAYSALALWYLGCKMLSGMRFR